MSSSVKPAHVGKLIPLPDRFSANGNERLAANGIYVGLFLNTNYKALLINLNLIPYNFFQVSVTMNVRSCKRNQMSQ